MPGAFETLVCSVIAAFMDGQPFRKLRVEMDREAVVHLRQQMRAFLRERFRPTIAATAALPLYDFGDSTFTTFFADGPIEYADREGEPVATANLSPGTRVIVQGQLEVGDDAGLIVPVMEAVQIGCAAATSKRRFRPVTIPPPPMVAV